MAPIFKDTNVAGDGDVRATGHLSLDSLNGIANV